jgi:hypothetical protein
MKLPIIRTNNPFKEGDTVTLAHDIVFGFWHLFKQGTTGRVLAASEENTALDPNHLDYDNYFTDEVKSKIKDFIPLSKAEYLKILADNGFTIQSSQKHLF